MKRISIITNATAPYRTLQIRKFSQIPNVRITVYYCEKKTRQWEINPIGNGVEEVFLDMIFPFNGTLHWKLQLHRGLPDIVKSSDVVIDGSYYTISDNLIIHYCKKYHVPFVLLSDGFEPHRIGKKENFFKFKRKKQILNNTAFIFGNGTVSREYFEKTFGYPPDRIINQVLTVDIDTISGFYSQKETLCRSIREQYHIAPSQKVILYSGRLVDFKNVKLLIEAIASIPSKEEYTLLITGDGEERSALSALAKNLGTNCIITGFLENQPLLFQHYYAADCLVLPSLYDPWGLVINEAMAAHLPVICTTYCGAGMDLVKDNYNGYVVKSLDPQELANAIQNAVANKEMFGEHSYQMILDWTFDKSSANFRQLLDHIESKKQS